MRATDCSVPDPSRLGAIQELFDFAYPYTHGPSEDELFVRALRENVSWHVDRSPWYRKFLAVRHFSASRLTSLEACAALPFIHRHFFKDHELLSIRREDVYLDLVSSPARGRPTRVLFDRWSVGCLQRMLSHVFDYYGWLDEERPCACLVLGREPAPGPAFSASFTENLLCGLVPSSSVFYALRSDGQGAVELDLYGCIERLQSAARNQVPLRIFGQASLLHRVLARMRQVDLPHLVLPEDSLVFLSGGWADEGGRPIRRPHLHQAVVDQLCIPATRVRDCYSSVEHRVPYVECVCHNYHVPVWSRVFVRDVRTLEPLPPGEVGLLNLVSPYITSIPAQSVLTGDLAILRNADACSCDLRAPWFELVGRVPAPEPLERIPAGTGAEEVKA